jgi:hypothetical protein
MPRCVPRPESSRSSFPRHFQRTQRYKPTKGPRTIFEIVSACGYNMEPFSVDEKEVLIEGVSNFQLIRADKFNAEHPDVQSGEA